MLHSAHTSVHINGSGCVSWLWPVSVLFMDLQYTVHDVITVTGLKYTVHGVITVTGLLYSVSLVLPP